jgi:NAD(P)-dependent dehydrogenase (short-subunit alcohol dehydrogenase family)|tara:strand:+ start:1197 stop:1901 length:705 start_codon:yes stop_codon:yes gene_type:complete
MKGASWSLAVALVSVALSVSPFAVPDGASWVLRSTPTALKLRVTRSTTLAPPVVVVDGDAANRGILSIARNAATELAPLRGWVNNAAMVGMGTLHEADPEMVSRLFQLNVEGYFWGCSEAVRTFLDQRTGGAIVNISSFQARAAFPGWVAYAMSKAAVHGLTRNVAAEYGRAGIRANAVEPGAISTPWNSDNIARQAHPETIRAEMEGLSPLGRMGEASEIAEVVEFLLSPLGE